MSREFVGRCQADNGQQLERFQDLAEQVAEAIGVIGIFEFEFLVLMSAVTVLLPNADPIVFPGDKMFQAEGFAATPTVLQLFFQV